MLSIDDKANEAVYGQDTTPRMIFEDRTAQAPSATIAGFRDHLVDASAVAHAARTDENAPTPMVTTGEPMPAQVPAPMPAPAQTEPQPQPFQPVENPAKVEALPATP